MTFAHPLILLLLALPVLLGFWEWTRRGLRVRLPFDHGGQRHRRRLEFAVKLANLLPATLLAVAICFLAGPQRLKAPQAEREIRNIQFCLDMSSSMNAKFGEGQRYTAALKAIQDFASFRKDGAFGLSVFGAEVIHWMPVTRDLSALRLAAPMLEPKIFPGWFGGTMIAKAARSVMRELRKLETGDRMIILISDGESSDLNNGAAEEIGAELAAENIALFYIHVAEGEPQAEAAKMAMLSGGDSFAAGDPQALKAVFAKIDAMSPAKMKPPAPEPVDFFRPWSVAGLSVLGACVLTLFGLRFVPW